MITVKFLTTCLACGRDLENTHEIADGAILVFNNRGVPREFCRRCRVIYVNTFRASEFLEPLPIPEWRPANEVELSTIRWPGPAA